VAYGRVIAAHRLQIAALGYGSVLITVSSCCTLGFSEENSGHVGNCDELGLPAKAKRDQYSESWADKA
jgi:hypothetical protein